MRSSGGIGHVCKFAGVVAIALLMAACGRHGEPKEYGIGTTGSIAAPGSPQEFAVNVGDLVHFEEDSSTLSGEARSILGHHDAAHDTITISKLLDSPDVPEWFVEYILFHEMLHIKHPARLINGRRYYHTAAFRAEEQRYPGYAQAQEWLDQFGNGMPIDAEQQFGLHFHNWLEAHVLRREAEALLSPH